MDLEGGAKFCCRRRLHFVEGLLALSCSCKELQHMFPIGAEEAAGIQVECLLSCSRVGSFLVIIICYFFFPFMKEMGGRKRTRFFRYYEDVFI